VSALVHSEPVVEVAIIGHRQNLLPPPVPFVARCEFPQTRLPRNVDQREWSLLPTYTHT
jgi:hypothetical protein